MYHLFCFRRDLSLCIRHWQLAFLLALYDCIYSSLSLALLARITRIMASTVIDAPASKQPTGSDDNRSNALGTATSPKTIMGFDLYGTLLSTRSIADELAKAFGEETAGAIAATWRQRQLEYTWRLNSMGELI